MLQKERIQQLDVPSCKGHDTIFTPNLLMDIPGALSQWACSRVLLVASKSIPSSPENSKISALQLVLGSSLIDTKIGVGRHSPYPDVLVIASRIQKHRIDCVISVGSDSYSDACKNASFLAANLDPGFDVDDIETLVNQDSGFTDSKDTEPLCARACRLILVYTSLLGGEWNAVGSAVNSRGKKQHFGFWDKGRADLILLDPEVAYTSPEELWISSGMRCVDHCVELMCNPTAGEPGYEGLNAHAEKGLRRILRGLTEYKKAKDEGDSSPRAKEGLMKSISECQYGAREVITDLLIYRVPMGPSHAIGHQLGTSAGVPHGVTSGVMLAPTVSWQGIHLHNPHYKKTQARILDIFNETFDWQEESLADALVKFVKSLGLPMTLREINVGSEAQIHGITTKTMTDI